MVEETPRAQSFLDLAEDLDSLLQLAISGQKRLEQFETRVSGGSAFQRPTQEMLRSLVERPKREFGRIQDAVQEALERRKDWETDQDLSGLISLKKTATDRLRALQGVAAGVIVSGDWQSPSFSHALHAQAGRHAGTIRATENDYQRDHHADAKRYERAFLKQYVDAHFHFPLNAYAVSSGMAALTTVLVALQKGMRRDDRVCVGASSYFENKILLRQMFGDRLMSVDEMDTAATVEAVVRLKPKAIFLDTLCNAGTMAMPDLAALLPALSRALDRPTFLVLDNSALAAGCQPLRHLPLGSNLRLIVIESLNKFHQFGFDRVTGGLIWTAGIPSLDLQAARMHAGTNIPDASALALPEPARLILDRRLARLGRNTHLLADALDRDVRQSSRVPFSHVTYPGLPSYRGYAWTRERSFLGASFVLSPKPSARRIPSYFSFLQAAVKEAKKRAVDLNGGTSFGFDVTRVYVTARYAGDEAEPFVRISPGTETAWEIERLKTVFARAVDAFRFLR